jgi:DNA-directed RNA polymerase subunit omega
MARVTIEDCLDQVENRFALVRIAAKRSRELAEDRSVAYVEAPKNKEAVVALREIAAGKVSFDQDVSQLLTTWTALSRSS